MKSILRFVRPYWKTVCLVVVLLVVQAYCDLALPAYTSDIVDTGIQYNGIEHVTPTAIRRSELDHLKVFMNQEDQTYVESLYTEEGEICRLTEMKKSDWEKADAIFSAFSRIAAAASESIIEI